MIYGLETETGHIYTDEEYWEQYKEAMPDRGVVGLCWDQLTKLDIEPERIEEERKKIFYIWGPEPLQKGDIIVRYSNPPNYDQKYLVQDFNLEGEPLVSTLGNWNNTYSFKSWKGPYIKISFEKNYPLESYKMVIVDYSEK